MKPNKVQLLALKRVYDRCPVYKPLHEYYGLRPMTYREFRKGAWMWDGTLMVDWCGMMLGIEEDGYTHS